jgi:hypothetical protein
MKFLARVLLFVIVASAAVFSPAARAQTPNPGTTPTTQPAAKPGTVGASAGDGFDELVDNDVAKGYYSQEQGAALKSQFNDAYDRVTAALEKPIANLTSYANLVKTSGENQVMDTSIYSFVDAKNNVQIGRGTPQEIQDQAETLYAMADQNFQVLATVVETLTPAVSDILNELQQVVAARAALIQANPAVSADVKHNAQYESNKFSDYVKNDLDRGLATVSATLRADQDIVESNKTQIVQTLTKALPLFADYTEKYGPDPKKWPPIPKGYFSTTGATASNGTSGNSNGAAGNGSGTNSGSGTITGSGVNSGAGASAGSGANSGTGSSSSSGATAGIGQGTAQATPGTGAVTGGTGYASQSGSPQPDDYDNEPLIIIKYNRDTNSYTETVTGFATRADGTSPNGTFTYPADDDIAPPGYNQLVEGAPSMNDPQSSSDAADALALQAQLTSLLSGGSPGPYSDSDLNGGSFAAIYTGYTVTPGQNGSTVIPVTSNQVQTPSSVMTMPSDQVQTGTNQILVPSTQVNTPSSLINMPGTQVATPSSLISMPSTQLPTPSLCGR